MKNIFTILNLSKMKKQIIATTSRFPITVWVIIIVALLFLLLLHWDFSQDIENNLIRWIFAWIVAFFFSIWFYLYWESKNYLKWKNNLLQILPVWYGSLFFIFFQNRFNSLEEIIFFLLSMTGILWFLYFAPYIHNIVNNTGKQSIYYTYFYNISVIILISFILGWVLFILWAIWITAVHTLFDLSWYFTNDIYWDWAIIALSMIAPLFALNKIPKKSDFTNDHFNENAFFSFLVKYIAIPFIYIYFIILYLYSAKVLMNFGDWPKGEVSWMVIWFSIFGYLIYIFSYIFEEKNNFIKIFRKFFPFAVVPQVFMLFYAIYLRINQYDITVNRYFVIVFWIWLLLVSLYYIFSKKKYLGNLIVWLTLFTIIISVGPWSVYQLPESRQLERLKDNLIEANILQDSSIVPLQSYTDINSKLSKEIYGGIDYLCNFDNCSEIKKLFPKITQTLIDEKESQRLEGIKAYPDNDYYQKQSGPNSWAYISKITKTIKVENYTRYDSIENKSYLNFSMGKDKLFPINTQNSKNLYMIDISSYQNSLNYNKEANTITIRNNEVIITVIDLWDIKKALASNYTDTRITVLDAENMIYDINNSYWNFTLFITNINFENPEYKWDFKNWYLDINWYLLEK